ncbi:MAG: YfhO family protein, partial [Hungatella sp.]|nr:YfhO family protein [Hungatella sp.]
MEHDDEIEKISKELEDILQMTSGEKENTTGEKDLKEGNEEERVAFDPQGERAEQEFDLASAPGIHLDIPVDGMEELFDGDMDYGEDLEQEKETVPDQDFMDISEEPEYDEDEGELEIGQLESFKERASGKKDGKAASLVRPSDGLLAAFFVPMVIMIIIFAQRGIFPFGEESFLRT